MVQALDGNIGPPPPGLEGALDRRDARAGDTPMPVNPAESPDLRPTRIVGYDSQLRSRTNRRKRP